MSTFRGLLVLVSIAALLSTFAMGCGKQTSEEPGPRTTDPTMTPPPGKGMPKAEAKGGGGEETPKAADTDETTE
ncbi:MAG: hypothetical protein GF320_01590 [Armatimonadia bacterium]|nr:hypothetical protein [Armatimonadia bacterium]